MLKTNCVVAALPQAELTKMLKKFARLSLQIVVGLQNSCCICSQTGKTTSV